MRWASIVPVVGGAPSGPAHRVLWVTDEVPDRALGGGNIRQAHLLAALADRVETHLLLAGSLGDDLAREAVAGVTEVPASPSRPPITLPRRRLQDLWLALGHPGPAEAFVSRASRRHLASALRTLAEDFDVVVVNHQGLSPLLPPIHRGLWVASLFHVSADKARQELPLAAGRRQRWLLEREALKARRLEDWIVSHYDAVVAVSQDDAAMLAGPGHGRAGGRVIVAPNGVDTDRYVPTPLPAAPRILMAASLAYRPNVDGALWFCERVLPRIHADVPGATLDIVGRLPVREVRDLAAGPGVDVHADVPSMVPWLARARVAVVPLRVGTGTRLKALEAMAAGRPLVGTTIGLSGLGLVDGIHARITDDPGAMAAAIVELLRRDELASRQVSLARALVERDYRWDRIGSEFARALLERA